MWFVLVSCTTELSQCFHIDRQSSLYFFALKWSFSRFTYSASKAQVQTQPSRNCKLWHAAAVFYCWHTKHVLVVGLTTWVNLKCFLSTCKYTTCTKMYSQSFNGKIVESVQYTRAQPKMSTLDILHNEMVLDASSYMYVIALSVFMYSKLLVIFFFFHISISSKYSFVSSYNNHTKNFEVYRQSTNKDNQKVLRTKTQWPHLFALLNSLVQSLPMAPITTGIATSALCHVVKLDQQKTKKSKLCLHDT